jgi:hypothetical protein
VCDARRLADPPPGFRGRFGFLIDHGHAELVLIAAGLVVGKDDRVLLVRKRVDA